MTGFKVTFLQRGFKRKTKLPNVLLSVLINHSCISCFQKASQVSPDRFMTFALWPMIFQYLLMLPFSPTFLWRKILFYTWNSIQSARIIFYLVDIDVSAVRRSLNLISVLSYKYSWDSLLLKHSSPQGISEFSSVVKGFKIWFWCYTKFACNQSLHNVHVSVC